MSNAKSQLTVTSSGIAIDFSSMSKSEVNYTYRHLGPFIDNFLNNVNLGDQWIVYYEFNGKVKSRFLDSDTIQYFKNQLSKEGFIADFEEFDSEYDMFPVNIKELQRLSIVNLSYAGPHPNATVMRKATLSRSDFKSKANYSVYQHMLRDGVPDAILNEFVDANRATQKTPRNGHFWNWTLEFPELDLERFMIFHRLDKHAASIIQHDDCLIYAIRLAGVDNDTVNSILVNTLRGDIKLHNFPLTKLKLLSEEYGITFHVNDCKGHTFKYGNGSKPIELLLYHNHYMLNERVPISPYYIRNRDAIRRECRYWKPADKVLVSRLKLGHYVKTKPTYKLKKVIDALFEVNAFKPIRMGDFMTFCTTLYRLPLAPLQCLEYNPKYCTRVKAPPKENTHKFERHNVVYFDFEASTDGAIHKPYCICYRSTPESQDQLNGYYYGSKCAKQFLDTIQDYTLCYAHNVSYDICFIMEYLDVIFDNPIIRHGRVLQLTGMYHNKTIQFKDTYSIITKPLREFPTMFHLDTGRKEVFPYQYYNESRIGQVLGNTNEAAQYVNDPDAFIQNVNDIAYLNHETFDMRAYCVFYCNQDVNILCQGFEWFRHALLDTLGLDAYEFVSISSIANRYMEVNCYWPNGKLYDLANTPREFISRCIIGGRCMLRDNKPQSVATPVVDFDAVSLYPSAMTRLYTLESIPLVLTPSMLSTEFLMSHLFEDEQTDPTTTRYISGFFIQVRITSVGTQRHFPLITNTSDKADERNTNDPCTMYIDHIMYQDLIRYQGCTIVPLRGYYYNSRRDTSIRRVIQHLFELRLQYKREGNPLQEIIKLLLNSIYGKTILRPIDDKTKFIKKDDWSNYIRMRYNYMIEAEMLTNSNNIKVRESKPINRHFTFAPLGVNILSMSKRIMNEVICTAEDINIPIYYQDTDSIHTQKQDLPRLDAEFKLRYHRDLIGKSLCQFHPDFAPINQQDPVAVKSVFIMKKTYIDKLMNASGDVAFHVRCKGIPTDVVVLKANELYPNATQCHVDGPLVYGDSTPNTSYSIELLYDALHSGQSIQFDLCSGTRPCFDMRSNFTITTKSSFVRRISL